MGRTCPQSAARPFHRVGFDATLKRMTNPRLIFSSDLALTGQDPRVLAKLCQQGRLTRIRQGVYLPTDEWEALSEKAQYGCRAEAFRHLAFGEPVFCYATAALLWGLWIIGTPSFVHVRTEVRNGGRSGNGVKRRLGAPTDVPVRCGQLLVTDKLTTTIQLIHALSFQYAVAICDSSLHSMDSRNQVNQFSAAGTSPVSDAIWETDSPQGPPLTKEELADAALLLPSRAARDRALAVIAFSSSLSGSAGESISRAKMHLLGFPAPVLQKEFALRDRKKAFTDFWFEEPNVAGEFDGKGKYLRSDWGGGLPIEQRVMKEKAREDDIRRQGTGLVRWNWRELNDTATFEQLLRQAGLPQSRGRPK